VILRLGNGFHPTGHLADNYRWASGGRIVSDIGLYDWYGSSSGYGYGYGYGGHDSYAYAGWLRFNAVDVPVSGTYVLTVYVLLPDYQPHIRQRRESCHRPGRRDLDLL
jgi:hypothetical protein